MNVAVQYHVPVMLGEAVDGLAIRSGGIYVDGTLGGGGHFFEIVRRLGTSGTAIGIDRDSDSIQWVRNSLNNPGCRVILVNTTFSHISDVLAENSISGIDGAMLDLGVSSHQIDDPVRGFTYKTDVPLDMRMDQDSRRTAADLIAENDHDHLAAILEQYGEVRNPSRMAGAILRYHGNHPLKTSGDLRDCLEQEYGTPLKFKVLSKVFQALRIGVNGELDELRAFLNVIVSHLNTGGRLAVIAYHSLEDRLVKNFFSTNENPCSCPQQIPVCRCGATPLLKRINRKALTASESEIAINTRARSARLRIAEKI